MNDLKIWLNATKPKYETEIKRSNFIIKALYECLYLLTIITLQVIRPNLHN
jgi:hypothetical protein